MSQNRDIELLEARLALVELKLAIAESKISQSFEWLEDIEETLNEKE